MHINIRRTHPQARLPQYASAGAACFDLSALDAGEVGACGGVFNFRTGAGDRIAQALVVPLPSVQFVEVDTLSDTDRGASGFGSTGARALPSTAEF